MKKTWNSPNLNEVEINETNYTVLTGTVEDGSYVDENCDMHYSYKS